MRFRKRWLAGMNIVFTRPDHQPFRRLASGFRHPAVSAVLRKLGCMDNSGKNLSYRYIFDASRAGKGKGKGKGSSASVLVVDDFEQWRRLVRADLEKEGLHVIGEAADG